MSFWGVCLMSELLEAFDAAVARTPDRIALIDGAGQRITFAELHARSAAMAQAWQRRGIGHGNRVLLAMPIGADLYAALAALWRLGATVVLPEPAMGLQGLRHAARITRPDAFCASGLYRLLKLALPRLWTKPTLSPPASDAHRRPDPVEVSGADIALISFTSGTTGAPKAIPRSHDFLAAQHQAVAPLMESETAERDLVAFPVFVLINIACGRSSVLPNWRLSRPGDVTAEALAGWITAQQVTRALLPPVLCETLSNAPIPDSLTQIFTGGGPVFPDLLERLSRSRKGLRITCIYGSTEAEPIAHLDASEIRAEHHAAMVSGCGLLVGRPVNDIRLRIRDQEIQVAGAHVNDGYLDPAHDLENKIHEDGTIWHQTGDAGDLDADGMLWLLGRVGTEVHINDERRYPFSVEVAARQWPGVHQCALSAVQSQPCLIIEGDQAHFEKWQQRAAVLGISKVMAIAKMPMDKRHASKIDRTRLRKLT